MQIMIIEYPPELNFYLYKSIDTLLRVYLCHEKVNDNNEFSCGNLKPCHESRISTCQVEPSFMFFFKIL